MIFLAAWMLVAKLKYLRRLLYHEAATPALQDKVAGLMAVYGMGILGVGIMIKMMLEALRWNCQHIYHNKSLIGYILYFRIFRI